MIDSITIQINGRKIELSPDEFKALADFFNQTSSGGKQGPPPITIQPAPYEPLKPIWTKTGIDAIGTKMINSSVDYVPDHKRWRYYNKGSLDA